MRVRLAVRFEPHRTGNRAVSALNRVAFGARRGGVSRTWGGLSAHVRGHGGGWGLAHDHRRLRCGGGDAARATSARAPRSRATGRRRRGGGAWRTIGRVCGGGGSRTLGLGVGLGARRGGGLRTNPRRGGGFRMIAADSCRSRPTRPPDSGRDDGRLLLEGWPAWGGGLRTNTGGSCPLGCAPPRGGGVLRTEGWGFAHDHGARWSGVRARRSRGWGFAHERVGVCARSPFSRWFRPCPPL